MITYKDRSYCSCFKCTNEKCDRYVTKYVRDESERMKLPLALVDFSIATMSEDGEVNEGCRSYRV